MTIRENQVKLIEALESGKYKQGYGKLKFYFDDEILYCCLGVACEVLGHYGTFNDREKFFDFLGDRGYMPDAWAEEFDITNQQELVTMNDSEVNFCEIAAYLRKKWNIEKDLPSS